MIILVFLSLALYVAAPLFFTKTFYVPGFLTVFSIPFLIFINRNHIYQSDLSFIAKILFVLLLTAFLSPGIDFLAHKIFAGVLQTVVSIIAGIFLVKTMDRLKSKDVAKVFFWLSIFLLIGATLEVVGVLSNLSDAFRAVVFGQGVNGYGIYSANARDLILAGFVRPKFFTSEPSLLAIGFSIFSNAWLILSPQKKNYLLFFAGTAIMLYLSASPVFFISILMSVCIIIYHGSYKRNILLYGIIGLIFFVVVGAGLFFTGGEVIARLGDRINDATLNAFTYKVTSGNLRIVFPFITMIDVMRNSPFFGVGIAGKNVLSLYSSLPFYSTVDLLGNNNLATLFIYMGGIGATLFILTFYQYLRRFLSRYELLLLLALVLGFMQMMGGFESPRFWGYVFIFIGVLKKSYSSNSEKMVPQQNLWVDFGSGRAPRT